MDIQEIIKIIVLLLIISIIYQVCGIFKRLKKLISAKTDSINSTSRQFSITRRVEASERIMQMINNLVDIEISSLIASMELVHVPYNILSRDSDIKKISNRIFNSLKIEAFVNNELLVKDEYLLEYITSRVSIGLQVAMIKTNVAIYSDT